MDYANKLSTDRKITEKTNRTATSSAVGIFRAVDAEAERWRANFKGHTEIRSACDVTNAFLKMQFYPRLQETEVVQDCDSLKMEREFKKSLSIINKKFSLSVVACKNIPFPYNIAESMSQLKEQLKEAVPDWREIRLIHHNNSTFFAMEERYDTGMSLYYIPVIPLYNFLYQRGTSRIGKLLLSVYAYIYQILDVPYYRIEGCYLNSVYDMLESWVLDDGAEEDLLQEIEDAKRIGDHMYSLISDPKSICQFKKRFKSFTPKTDFEHQCMRVVSSFFELFTSYPKVRIDRKFYPMRFRDKEQEDERPITLDNYVSFCASIRGCLFESLCQSVNEELQEYSEIDEPTRFIPFDGRTIADNDFEFEHKVFESLDSLIAIWQNHNF